MTPRQFVINKRPGAFACLVGRGRVLNVVYVPHPGHGWKRHFGLTHPPAATWCKAIGSGRTSAEAWEAAAKSLKGKRARRPEVRQETVALIEVRREEARKRGRDRAALALRVGTYVLNALEHGGQMSLKNYLSVTPRWVLSRYDHRRKQ